MNFDRYARQIAFEKIGRDGQQKICASRAAIIGLGALGTVIADELCRAGVGFLRLIDRDVVDISNLQRQVLYTEDDAREQIPKAFAAYAHLSKTNSEIKMEPVFADVNSSNIEAFVSGVDLVLDGSDNFELRYLLNEACHKHHIPWIYGGAVAASGSVMNILDGGPCFRCLLPEVPAPGSYPVCATSGVLNMITGIVASIEAAEAVKILSGSQAVSKKYRAIDLWENTFDAVEVHKNPDCPVCGKGQYEFLGKSRGAYTTSLCGRDAIQVVPEKPAEIDFAAFAAALEKTGAVKCSPFMLSFDDGKTAFNLLKDGRAIIKNVKDEKQAKAVYAEYVGL
ncbi:MAG: ThiF family adenylyltransferase [Treponema sp.]|jgi:adenylyltransferase/sulfurtransferase|nr:ThiF family adenylyltransferase [Treponema sp.]